MTRMSPQQVKAPTEVRPNRADRRRERRGLATRAEVASYLGVPLTTLEKWAYKGMGPRYAKVGRHARYAWSDVDAWVEAQAGGGAT